MAEDNIIRGVFDGVEFDFTPDFETDLDFIAALNDLILEETDYTEVIIVALNEENEVESSHS